MYPKRRRTSYMRRFARRANGYKKRRTGRFTSRSAGRRSYGRMITRNPITADTFFVKLKYGEIRNILGSALTSGSYVWRGNSIFDPDFTSAGGSVSGAAQWFALYGDVVILGSKATVRVINGTGNLMQCCLYPNKTSTPVGSGVGDLREIPYGRTKTTAIYNANAENRPVTVSNYFSTAKMYTVSKQNVKDTVDYWHQGSNNPSRQWFWVLQCEVPSVPSALNWVQDVSITYYCMFKRRVSVQL